jgi:hypothetical protein
MRKNLLICLAVLLFTMWCGFIPAGEAASLNEEDGARAGSPGSPAGESSQRNPPKLGYGVHYTLDGRLIVQKEAITLHISDGRIFQLIMDGKTARNHHGKMVRIEGMIKQADMLDYVKVQKITAHAADLRQVEEPAFKPQQTPPTLASQKDDLFTIRNFRWDFKPDANDGKKGTWVYETVRVNPAKVQNVYFAKKPFAPEWIAAHSFLVYTFAPGGLVNSKGEEAKSMVLSIEAYQRTNQSYSLTEGLKKTFAVSWILATWENYLAQSCKYADEKLILYPCVFTHEQNTQLVRETLKQAVVNRSGEFYHTLTNNCTNNLILLFNYVLPEKKRIKLWTVPALLYNFRATMPVIVPPMLIKRGICTQALPTFTKSNYQVDIEAFRKK